MKYSEYFGVKRHLSLKNENIRYDITTARRESFACKVYDMDWGREY